MAEDKVKAEDKKIVSDSGDDFQFEDAVCSAEFAEGCKVPEDDEKEEK
ncbi:hypothetical protein SDC9_177238 [bioreactor metagenome]|uniref:Uncharacterized protein n=1 Tax=bioreactor metagenome TaxID=1076179 RepID=A0A645GSR7_9ZZZZ